MKSKSKVYCINKGKWKKADTTNPLNLKINNKASYIIDTHFLNIKNIIVYNMLELCENLRSITPMHAINWNLDLNALMKEYPTTNGKKLLRKYYYYAQGHWKQK